MISDRSNWKPIEATVLRGRIKNGKLLLHSLNSNLHFRGVVWRDWDLID